MTDDSTEDGAARPEPELSDEEIVARLDELLDDDPGDEHPPADDAPEEPLPDEQPPPAPILGDAILSAAELRSPPPPEDLGTPDPAAEQEVEAEERWDPVDDTGQDDLELQATEQPKTQEEVWDDVPDDQEADLVLVDVEERTGDPWGEVQGNDYSAPPEPPPPAPVQPVPPVARRATDEPAHRPAPSRSLPWRGTTSLREPDLPDLLYVADVTSERSRLLVAAWEWDEDQPGGTGLRFRLADDGPELVLPAVAPHEAALDVRLVLEGESVRIRLALALGREQRGVRLGRDLLAGRFQVDPGRDAWPDTQDE